ncbi:hypothetical protein PybrP1_004484 [[Pythium] brassicae (nom. inval.)]|nr:hypothetical protein PybrP1_004484 [[Pythium] brassicae (nom. inval.)]
MLFLTQHFARHAHVPSSLHDTVELGGVRQRLADKFERRDVHSAETLLRRLEPDAAVAHDPFGLALLDEREQVRRRVQDEHLLRVAEREALVRDLGAVREVLAHSLQQVRKEEAEERVRHVLARLQHLVVAAFHQVLLQLDAERDVWVLARLLWEQLQLQHTRRVRQRPLPPLSPYHTHTHRHAAPARTSLWNSAMRFSTSSCSSRVPRIG